MYCCNKILKNKSMEKLLLFTFTLISVIVSAQNVGIGTNNPDPSAKLHIDATNSGVLIPKVNLTSASDATTVTAPATGLILWNTGATFGTAGFYYNVGSAVSPNWIRILDSSSSIADADADPNNEFQTVNAGNGLTGGGNGTTVNLNVGAGNGISSNANDISVNVDGTEIIINGSNQLEIGNIPAGDTDYIQNQNSTDQVANYRISGNGQLAKVIATANGDWFLRGGDDGELRDINQANFIGLWGRQSPDRAGLQLGSDGSYIFGEGGNIGIGTIVPDRQLTLGATGAVFGVQNTANFQAKNSTGNYETYLWPRWSDNIMYLNYGSGGFNIRNNASVTTMFMDNDGSIDIKKGVLFNCDDCGSTSTIDGTSNYGDLVIQGRVLSSNSNLHFSPPGGSNVIINSSYRAAGSASTGNDPGLIIEGNGLLQAQGGLETDKRYYYFQRQLNCNCYGPGSETHNLGAWDFCALAHVGFKNNRSNTDEDDDVQCAVYPNGQGGSGESTNYTSNFTQNHNQRPTWIMYFEAFEDTNGVTCAASCINFKH